jgi:DNA polymerase III sliding clamp (beta) subunit (PCNA family)
MNFKISKRILFNALSVVARAISSNSPLPWLTGVKIEIKDGELILTGSDSDISIQKVIQKNDDDFDCTYAYIEFSAPESVVKFFDGIKTGKLPNVSEKFKAELEAMENGKEPNAAIVEIIENIVKDLK